jgi:large subunit ribosomal protein L6
VSRIGKMPITLIKGVQVKVEGTKVTVTGPKGSLTQEVADTFVVKVEQDQVTCMPKVVSDSVKPLWGLYRMLINNMAIGVSNGYKIGLEVVGVGYKAELKGKDLKVACGFSEPVTFEYMPGIVYTVENQTKIGIEGIDKELVGRMASKIRAVRPPEPYKGKGIRYAGEVVRTKAGKAAVK